MRFTGPGTVQAVDFGAGAKPLDTSRQYYDQVSWFRGRHSFKFGAQLLLARFENQSIPAALFGDWLFSNRYTGWAYADFLLGLPSEASRQFPNPRTQRRRSLYSTGRTGTIPVWTCRTQYRALASRGWAAAPRQAVGTPPGPREMHIGFRMDW